MKYENQNKDDGQTKRKMTQDNNKPVLLQKHVYLTHSKCWSLMH